VVNGSQTIDATLVASLVGQQKGFLGIEYLIFAQDSPSAALTQLTAADTGGRRRALAAAMALELASSAQQLASAWSPSSGNYAGQVETAGMGSTAYSQQRGAVDDYVGGIAYALELVVGVRLAMPLGLKTTGTPDPSLDPTSASDSAVADITASLGGVTAMFDGAGFASALQSMNAALDTQAMSEMSACTKAVAAIPPPFVTAVVSSTATVQAAYDACKTWKNEWDADITSAIGATLHPDNDGD
jgi:predicted lipoprotein